MFKKVLASVFAIGVLVFSHIQVKRYQEHYMTVHIEDVIQSKVLNEDRKVFVRLPTDYDAARSYPLVIKSDGNFNLDRWDESLNTLSKKRNIKNSIVVAIPNLFWTDSRNRDLVPPYARKDVNIDARPKNENAADIFGKADLFLAFIEQELIPHIESNYSINENRLLSGFSAGGSFVLYTIVTRPELFSGYFAFSPAAWYDGSVVVQEFSSHLDATAGEPFFLYLSLGGNENDIITGSFKGLLNALQTSAPDNLKWAYSYSENAGHAENPYISLPKALIAYYQFRADNFSHLVASK